MWQQGRSVYLTSTRAISTIARNGRSKPLCISRPRTMEAPTRTCTGPTSPRLAGWRVGSTPPTSPSEAEGRRRRIPCAPARACRPSPCGWLGRQPGPSRHLWGPVCGTRASAAAAFTGPRRAGGRAAERLTSHPTPEGTERARAPGWPRCPDGRFMFANRRGFAFGRANPSLPRQKYGEHAPRSRPRLDRH